jgi:hypothetical protein
MSKNVLTFRQDTFTWHRIKSGTASVVSGVPGSIPGHYQKKVVGLERGPLSLVNTTEELLDRKVAASV